MCASANVLHITALLTAEASNGVEPDVHSVVSAQGSAQGGMGMPSVLSGGSSGLSSPVRESGHLDSLLEVNSRVEAAMDRARAQLQANYSLFTFSSTPSEQFISVLLPCICSVSYAFSIVPLLVVSDTCSMMCTGLDHGKQCFPCMLCPLLCPCHTFLFVFQSHLCCVVVCGQVICFICICITSPCPASDVLAIIRAPDDSVHSQQLPSSIRCLVAVACIEQAT